nr:MAG TPA: hypothetical protein [Crassvirales sp.]
MKNSVSNVLSLLFLSMFEDSVKVWKSGRLSVNLYKKNPNTHHATFKDMSKRKRGVIE